MANPLTGNYDAVVQIAVRQINGLLAALHQNAASEAAELKLLHSVELRLPFRTRRPPLTDALAEWVREYQRLGIPRGFPTLQQDLVSHAPAGVARTLADALDRLDEVLPVDDPPETLNGRAQLQLSTLRLSVPPGSSTKVTIHAHLRARYVPSPGTPELPAPIHGEVHAGFDVRTSTVGGRRRLVIRPSADDADITFTAAAGTNLTAADVARLTTQVRTAVRNGFDILPVDVPTAFPFSEFKGVGNGSLAALALPLSLSGGGLPPNAIHSITNSFLGSSGFGFAVSREHVASLFDVEAIREQVRQQTIPLRIWTPFGSVTVTYRLRFASGPTLSFTNGAIVISGRIDVTHPTFPDGWVSFKQRVTLELDDAGRVRLEALGDPDVDDSLLVPHGTAVDAVRREMNKAIRDNRPVVRQVFADALNALTRGIQLADDLGGAGYTSVEITPDGILARGDIVGSGRAAPVIVIEDALQGQALSAFKSWIPAGDITRFIWSWVEYTSPTAWSGVLRIATDEHGFVLPKPVALGPASQVCLRVEGTQTVPSGLAPTVAGGRLCRIPRPDSLMDAPSWFAPVTVPVWQPDIAPDEVMRDAMAAHVSVQSNRPQGDQPGANTLVLFADLDDPAPFASVKDALARVAPRYAGISVIVVVRPGSLERRRREIEATLSMLDASAAHLVHVTEDDEAGWTKTFAPDAMPAAFLIDARRRLAWTSSGRLEADALAKALDAHVIPAPPPQRALLALSVAVGERAPDAFFSDGREHRYALHRLRGRRLLLNFWQSWSAPSLTELRRLQTLAQSGERAPFIVAFHGGNDGRAVDVVRKQLGLTFPLVQDDQQRIGRAYGVSCWPTTVAIDAEGRVADVQFGCVREGKRG